MSFILHFLRYSTRRRRFTVPLLLYYYYNIMMCLMTFTDERKNEYLLNIYHNILWCDI